MLTAILYLLFSGWILNSKGVFLIISILHWPIVHLDCHFHAAALPSATVTTTLKLFWVCGAALRWESSHWDLAVCLCWPCPKASGPLNEKIQKRRVKSAEIYHRYSIWYTLVVPLSAGSPVGWILTSSAFLMAITVAWVFSTRVFLLRLRCWIWVFFFLTHTQFQHCRCSKWGRIAISQPLFHLSFFSA